jgi:lipopolysaccharide cholinephosphotransferase
MEDFLKYNGENTLLRKAQLRMLYILKVVDEICQKNNIEYFLDGGSCLGAVRHGGFIPWDDDLDIAVKRDDFLKLRKILPQELPENLVYQDETTDKNFCLKIAKVRDKNSKVTEIQGMDVKEKGIYIDIIPVEPILSFKSYNFITFFYGRAFRRMKNFNNNRFEYVAALLMWFPVNILVIGARLLAKMIHSKKICHIYGWNAYNYYDKDVVFPTKRVKFEDAFFPAPHKTDVFLSRIFGDYMQIPPENSRITHANKIEFYD